MQEVIVVHQKCIDRITDEKNLSNEYVRVLVNKWCHYTHTHTHKHTHKHARTHTNTHARTRTHTHTHTHTHIHTHTHTHWHHHQATNLGQTVNKCHGKEKICIGTPSMYPEVPEDRTQHRGHQEHGEDHKGIAKV